MDCTDVIKELGYADSHGFLAASSDEFETAPGFGHIFRRARDRLDLRGVYTLRNPRASAGTPLVPIVYVCAANSEENANEIHRLVWNQDVTPFVLVTTPTSVRLYSGFSNSQPTSSAADGAPGLLKIFHEVSEITDLHADAIDTGAVWRSGLARSVGSKERVDWKLLENLKALSQWLQRSGELEAGVAHALIGKYVYLHYLRDRKILSNRKLRNWGISQADIFGRDATLQGFRHVADKLDEWLNGSVFPIGNRDTVTKRHLGHVAATFAGDQPRGDGSWQLHLDFKAYNFSYIPIETLSVIYEQFLHEPGADGRNKGKDAGAYYTPIPVVNFMLAEMDDRRPLKQGMRVYSVANFSNLAEVLFAGRSRVPAAALFFGNRANCGEAEDECINTYSPLVANQESTRPAGAGKRTDTWSITLSSDEVRSVRLSEVASGDLLPWKIAAWGSYLDQRLLGRLRKQYPTLESLEENGVLHAAEGPKLQSHTNTADRSDEIYGKGMLNLDKLKGARHLFIIPETAVVANSDNAVSGRLGRSLEACRPPHVVVNAARNFAIFSDDYLVIPNRQIGIYSTVGDANFLKAISIYLSSDFAFYHQFFNSPQFGVQRQVSTLSALRKIPVPDALQSQVGRARRDWNELHSRLVKDSQRRLRYANQDDSPGDLASADERTGTLIHELNGLVFDVLGLAEHERILVNDFVAVRLALNDGKVGKAAIRHTTESETQKYAERLRRELNGFLEGISARHHLVDVVFGTENAMVCVDLVARSSGSRGVRVRPADSETGSELQEVGRRLRKKWAQWVYFDRNLTIFEGTRTYLFKPMQRFHWTESQAMLDAGEIISRTLASGGNTA